MELKVCTKCGHEKPLSDFHRKRNSLDSRCKVCIAQKKRECYKKKQRMTSRRKGTLLDFNVSFVSAANLTSLSQVLKGYFDDG